MSALSLSARRAWIEIVMQEIAQQRKQVALRKESVDRNATTLLVYLALIRVALRKESVDRNPSNPCQRGRLSVALRKESVDRNIVTTYKTDIFLSSLSARRAWIEISTRSSQRPQKNGRSPQGERG